MTIYITAKGKNTKYVHQFHINFFIFLHILLHCSFAYD